MAKYVIWNIIIAAVLLTLGASYVPRFFVTILMVVLIGFTMSIKVFVGAAYMLVYWCKSDSVKNKKVVLKTDSRIGKVIDSYREEIMDDVKTQLNNIK